MTENQRGTFEDEEPRKDFRSGPMRFGVLALVCLCSFGSVFAFDIPQALEQSYQERLEINQSEFNLLYTLFALPCVLSAIPLGLFVDKMGVRLGLAILTLGSLLGQALVTLAVYRGSYQLLLLGRAVQGISYESLIVAQAAITCFWFRNKESSLAMGFVITLPQLGDALNSLVTPPLFEATKGLLVPNLLALALTFLGFCSAIAVGFIDRRVEDQSGEKAAGHQQLKLQAVSQFGRAFWITVVLLMLGVGMFIAFMDNANSYFVHRFGFSQVEAGRLTMLAYLATVLSSPIVGTLADRLGRKRLLIFATTFSYFLSHLILYLSQTSAPQHNPYPAAGLILLGISYAMYGGCMYPAVADLVKPNAIGTAYGIETLLAALAMGLFPICTGLIVDSHQSEAQGFEAASLFYVGLATVAMVLAGVLLLLDQKYTSAMQSKAFIELADARRQVQSVMLDK